MIESCLEKVRIIRSQFPDLNIQVDGGIDCTNIHQVAAAGANVIVSGTGIFKHESPQQAIKYLEEAVNSLN
jgi:ribulose-phosphate 3-epimerase